MANKRSSEIHDALWPKKKKEGKNSKNVKARTHQAEFFMPRGEQWFLSIKYMNGKSN